MLSNGSKKSSKTTIEEFINGVKKGQRNFFDLLKVKEVEFTNASFDELMSNTDDVLVGVNRVQKNFNQTFFTLFNNCLVKHHDNGDIKFVFYTTTDDSYKIIDFAKILFAQLGQGIYDNRRFTPFTNHEKIRDLSRGIYFQETDEIVHVWFCDNVSFLLQYRISPLRQLSLMVTIKAPEKQDYSVRRKGTVLDLLQFNINALVNTEFDDMNADIVNDKIRFIDYLYTLDKKEFSAFDKALVRIFDSKSEFRKDVQTHITLYSSSPIDADTKIAVVESLYRIYGLDNSGSGELQMHERDILEAGTYWVGRTWRFNDQHGLWNMDDKKEKSSYEVRLSDMEGEEGFNLFISCYNELIDLFDAA
jgi:hypothetical protein